MVVYTIYELPRIVPMSSIPYIRLVWLPFPILIIRKTNRSVMKSIELMSPVTELSIKQPSLPSRDYASINQVLLRSVFATLIDSFD